MKRFALTHFALTLLSVCSAKGDGHHNFNRIATYNVCQQLHATCNVDNETVAEIVAATDDGMTLVYTDGKLEAIGMVNISDPANPTGMGMVDVGGEPTSVGVKDGYILASINTSPDFVNPSGELLVIDISSSTIVARLDIGGQPDSIAISPDKNYAAIAIENERDEDLNDGLIPQMPPGSVAVVDISNEDPTLWSISQVNLTALEGVLYNSDPEPEYVDINANNICVVTLQENNGIALIDLATGTVTGSFSAGAVDLEKIDIAEEDVITLDGSQMGRLREPDAITWIGTDYFATANEGDLDGGSRSWSIFDNQGNVVYEDGNKMDHATVRYGHYPEGRSENKGNEPEGILFATFGATDYLFVTSERASVIMVYDLANVTSPVFKQVLPVSVAPEGLKAIPERNLLVVSCEEDSRDNKIRSGIVVFEMQEGDATYPTLVSADRKDGTPIPFSALSGLAAKSPMGGTSPTEVARRGLASHDDDSHEHEHTMLYAVEDSAYGKNRMFTIDVTQFPYTVTTEIRIRDVDGIFAAALTAAGLDAAVLVNSDNTINVDPEGISVSARGGFWIVHEGRGSVGDEDRPVESPNVLLKLSDIGVIERIVLLPDEANALQLRFGFEGVAEYDDHVVVAFQRAWGDEEHPRIGMYNQETEDWTFYFYPLDASVSQNGGWVGLSDIASIGDGKFLVLERDNQGGPDAAVKKIYEIDLGTFDAENGSTLEKTIFRDIMPDLAAPNGNIFEKVEGLAVTIDGDVYIVNDNDGVEDNSGEQQLIKLEQKVQHSESIAPTPAEQTKPTPPSSAFRQKIVLASIVPFVVAAYIL